MSTHSWVIKKGRKDELESSSAFLQLFMNLMEQLGAIDLVHTVRVWDVRAAPHAGGRCTPNSQLCWLICFIHSISVSLPQSSGYRGQKT